MRIDIRKEDTQLDSALFADKKDNYKSQRDPHMGDYATEVTYSNYGGVPCVKFDRGSILEGDWDNVKRSVDAIFKAQSGVSG